ncbi:S-layer homology domain-containing protein [Oceanobacillus sp. CF4.6]|uniref:S-layer homology domain-containing protein n=1 Tax=Oceanobacillus sp. CF4.6 TaxID=3373080 RepID=UPI003EE5ADD8
MTKQKSSRKVFAITAAAAMAATAVVPTAVLAADVSFPDVENDSNNGWYKSSVDYLAEQDYVQGDEKGNFHPKDFVKRHSAAEVLRKALSLSTEGPEDFSDVDSDDWFYESVVAVSPEIFQGDGKGNFLPEKVLTRQEAAVAIVQAFDLEGEVELTFADSNNIDAWAKQAAEIALANEVITGKPDNLFAPKAGVTRAEYAVMVQRAIEAANKEVTPSVESVSAIDADTLEVTLSNGEVVTVDLTDVVLEANVETEVTFSIDGVEYTELVTYVPNYAALAEAEVAELEGITVEAISDLEVVADALAAAEEAVALVKDADVQAALQARIDAVVEANETTLADVVASVNNATTQVQLNNALQAFFNNVNSNLIAQYDDVLDGTETFVEEIQADINDVNVVTAVGEATTQIELLEALNNNGFESVNPDLIAEYAAAITGDETTAAEIQTDIDLVNAEASVDALLAADGSLAADQAEIDAAQALVTALVDAGVALADTDNNDAPDLQDTINAAQELLDIQVAIEEAQAAVAALVDADGNLSADQAEINAAQELVDALVAQGVTLPDADNDGNTDVQERIDEAQALLVTEVTETVAALVDAEGNLAADQAEIDAAQALVTALVDAGVALTDTDGDGTSDFQENINVAQDLLDTAAINAATTVTELEPLLVGLELPEYNNLTSTQRLEVAELFLEQNADVVFNNTAEVEVALYALDGTTGAESGIIVEYQAGIASVNDLTVDTITEMDAILDALNIDEYKALSASEQLVAAENVLNNRVDANSDGLGDYSSITQIVNNF